MTSFVFPGQGSQFIGMAKDFHDNFTIAKRTFEEIQDYVGINLTKIIFEDDENLINMTNFTQIAIFTASVSIFKTFEHEANFNNSQINVMMGHSLGEYTALACSKKLNLKDCSLILKERGELMNNAVEPNKTGMAALIGVNANEIEKTIKDNNLELQVANDNSPIQVVVSGNLNELNRSKNIFLNNDIKKFVQLNVSAAFHSKYMSEAQNSLNENIKNLTFNKNNIKIISNYSSEVSSDILEIKKSLMNQMSNKVRWTESIQKLAEVGEDTIIEIGPGKVLSGLIKRISNSFDIKPMSTIMDLKNL